MTGAVRAETGPGVPIVVGGRAVDRDAAAGLGADLWSEDPMAAVGLIEGFHAGETSAAG